MKRLVHNFLWTGRVYGTRLPVLLLFAVGIGTLIGLIQQSVMDMLGLVMGADYLTAQDETRLVLHSLLVLLVEIFVTSLVWGGVTMAAASVLRGKPLPLSQALTQARKGYRAFVRTGLMVFVVQSFVLQYIYSLAVPAAADDVVRIVVLVLLQALLNACFGLLYPVTVLEGLAGAAALRRGWRLFRANTGVCVAVSLVFTVLVTLLGLLSGLLDGMPETPQQILSAVWTSVLMPLPLIAMTGLYGEIAERKAE